MSVLLLFMNGFTHGSNDNVLPTAGFYVTSDFAEKISVVNTSVDADYYLWTVEHQDNVFTTVTHDLLFSASGKEGDLTIHLHAFSNKHPDHPGTYSKTFALSSGPAVDIQSTNILLCSNEYATRYEVIELVDFDYEWTVMPGDMDVVLNGHDTRKLTVDWPHLENDPEQILIQLRLLSGGGSAYHFFREVLLLPAVVPPRGEIIRKAEGSNLLIAPIDEHEEFLYDWKNASLDEPVEYNFWEFESIDVGSEYLLEIISRRFEYCTSTRSYMLDEGETANIHTDKIDQGEADENRAAMLVYPNPTDGDVRLHFNDMSFKHARISLYNVSGQLVHQESMKGFTGNKTLHFRMPGSERGVYFLHVEPDHGIQFFEKIIVR